MPPQNIHNTHKINRKQGGKGSTEQQAAAGVITGIQKSNRALKTLSMEGCLAKYMKWKYPQLGSLLCLKAYKSEASINTHNASKY